MFNKLNTIQVSQAVGCHRTTIHRWIRAGLPRNKDKTFDLPHVIEWMISQAKEDLLEEHAFTESCDSPALERYRTARAAMSELDLKIKEGAWIEKARFEGALAQRAMIFRSDLENFIRMHSSAMVRIVQGDDILIPDLISFWLENTEKFLDRYSRSVD